MYIYINNIQYYQKTTIFSVMAARTKEVILHHHSAENSDAAQIWLILIILALGKTAANLSSIGRCEIEGKA